jgi:tight adherence protein B
MNTWQIALLLLSCVSLIGLGLSSILVSRAQHSRERLQARFAMITAPHTRHRHIELSAFTRAVPEQNRSLAATLVAIFKIELEKPDLYPLPWWVVLLLTFIIANFARVLAEPLLGAASLPVLPICWVMLSRSFFGWAADRQRKKLLDQFPDALAMIVRSVRVGIPVMEAVRAVSRELPEPTAPEFAHLVDDVAVGKPLEDAVVEMAGRTGLPEYRFFATALSLQNQTGGTLSDTLDGLADVIRKRKALKDKGYAMTSEARMSALVLAVMPVLMGGGLWVLNPSYIDLLFYQSTGQKILGAAVASLSLGLYSIRTIIRKTLP